LFCNCCFARFYGLLNGIREFRWSKKSELLASRMREFSFCCAKRVMSSRGETCSLWEGGEVRSRPIRYSIPLYGKKLMSTSASFHKEVSVEVLSIWLIMSILSRSCSR